MPKPPACGKATVRLANAVFLTTPEGIVAVDPAAGWSLDESRNNPFYFFKGGEKYESARTLIYVNVQRLEVSFQQAIRNDEQEFRQSCQPSRIEDQPQPEILEQGCERKTQIFRCNRTRGAYLDLVTKISVGGLLINVVLSADNEAEISRYQKDYNYMLIHLGLAY